MLPVIPKEGCLVTGVAGFVGSHLAERLLHHDYLVVGVDNFFSGFPHNMKGFVDHPNFVFYEQSVTDDRVLTDLKARHPTLHYAFHLAAIVSVPYSVEHPEATMRVNYDATVRLASEAERLGFKALLFAGSAAEYGQDQRLPLLETYASLETAHVSPYGRSKFLASRIIASTRCGTALRCFNIYGPRQDPRSPYSGVISRFIELAVEGQSLTIHGDGLQTRDFIYVSDVVEAYLIAAGLSSGFSRPECGIYNIGTGHSTSVLELARTVNELADGQPSLNFGPERPGDIRFSVASVGAFSQATGWQAAIDLREGLRETIAWKISGSQREGFRAS
jgi:UDP-glucose 4-epimerase